MKAEGTKKKLSVRQHWYRTVTMECPVCGAGETYRVRVYGPPPNNPADRYEYHATGCAGGGVCYSFL
jgi:rRNA maturation protein Nop10